MRIERQQAYGSGETIVTRHYGVTVTGTPEELVQLRESMEQALHELEEASGATVDARVILGTLIGQLPTMSGLAAGDF